MTNDTNDHRLETRANNNTESKTSGTNIFENKVEDKDKFLSIALLGAGLLIGIGTCLVVASNWDRIPAFIKLFCDFSILGGLGYGVLSSINKDKPQIKELLIIILFLMIGASIGLIVQIFHISGGWTNYALAWAVLSLPFVAISKLVPLNIVWLLLFFSMFRFQILKSILEFSSEHIIGFPLVTLSLLALSYLGGKLDKKIGKYVLLPGIISKCSFPASYFAIITGGVCWGFFNGSGSLSFSSLFMHLLVFVFLIGHMCVAAKRLNINVFIFNAVLAEIYNIFAIFSCLWNLLRTGIGLIMAGTMIMISLYIIRKSFLNIKMKIEYGAQNRNI